MRATTLVWMCKGIVPEVCVLSWILQSARRLELQLVIGRSLWEYRCSFQVNMDALIHLLSKSLLAYCMS
jgi:hypothetical protein